MRNLEGKSLSCGEINVLRFEALAGCFIYWRCAVIRDGTMAWASAENKHAERAEKSLSRKQIELGVPIC